MSNADKAAVAALGAGITGRDEFEAKGSSMFSMFPLLTVSALVYGGLVLVAGGSAWTQDEIAAIQMISGETWVVRGGDVFVCLSLFLLFWEILRATDTGSDAIVNHSLSAILCIGCVVAFMALGSFATSAFFLLTIMTLVDFMAGIGITIRSARRDFGVG
ncbi:MAG: hypothetical protein AAF830_12430 [Pseudomonadota bacterium]